MKPTTKTSLLAALFGLAATACQPTAPPQAADDVEAAQNTLLAQHDTLMKRSFGLYKLRQELSAPALKADPRTAVAVHGLLAADAAMSAWMHGYHAPDSTAPAAQRLAYFRAQQQQLSAVEKQMQGTIDSATALLKSRRQ